LLPSEGDNLDVWGHKYLFLILVLTGCGGSDESTDPRAVEALNQACVEGRISGEFVVKMSDGSFELITAVSKKHLLKKIKNSKFKVKAESFEPNFRVIDRSSFSKIDLHSNQNDDYSEGPLFINADYLWDRGFKGAGAVTALIDSGYDFNHLLLEGSVLENVFDLGDDEDRNGFKGDRFGWDSFNNRPLTGDLGKHGTYVGSVIAGAHTNGIRLSVAPDSKIVPIAALQSSENGETDATGDSNSIIKAIDYAISRNVDFINASWGGDLCSNFIRERIRAATDSGIVFITSAGNAAADLDKVISFPASLPFELLLSVGSSKLDQNRESNSNFGNPVDFFALGKNVVVASPQNQLGSVTGTSVATPFITGGLALLKSAFPEASSEALIRALHESKNDKKIPDLKKAYLELEQL